MIAVLGAATAAHATVQPPCLTDNCPTASPTPSATPTDGSDDSGAVQTAPPAQPTDAASDAPTDPASATATPAAPSPISGGENPQHLYCDPGGFYEPQALAGRYMRGVGAVQSNYNQNGGVANMTFTAHASGTVGVSLSAGVNVTLNGLITKADAQFGVQMSTSLTAGLRNQVSFNVPSGHTGNAQYGVWRRQFTGLTGYMWSNCAETSHKVVAYGPYRVGWYIRIE